MCVFIAWGKTEEKFFDEQEENQHLHSLFCMNIRKSSHLSALLWVSLGTVQVMFLPQKGLRFGGTAEKGLL